MNEDQQPAQTEENASTPDSKAALVEPESREQQFENDPMEGVVEHVNSDVTNDEAPLRIIDGTPPTPRGRNGAVDHCNSSLSDEDDGDEQLVNLQQEATPSSSRGNMRRTGNLQRMSSQGADSSSSNSQRAPSSQNSSRDW